MTFHEALMFLGISEYEDRIIKSNSHGELFFLLDYVAVASFLKSREEGVSWFAPWFKEVVKWAEDNWSRPESVFQHLPRLFKARQPKMMRFIKSDIILRPVLSGTWREYSSRTPGFRHSWELLCI